jgi:hypothetical protein
VKVGLASSKGKLLILTVANNIINVDIASAKHTVAADITPAKPLAKSYPPPIDDASAILGAPSVLPHFSGDLTFEELMKDLLTSEGYADVMEDIDGTYTFINGCE